jgi:hypothetical protein
MTLIGPKCVLVAMLLPADAAAPPPASAAAQGTITIVIRETGHPEPVPARIEARDLAGAFHVAEDAVRIGGDCRNHDAPLPKLPLSEALAGLQTRAHNLFDRTENFYSTGRTRLVVPAGIYDITVSKGPEFRVARRRVAVDPSGNADISIALERWANLRAEGWYSADHHLHITRATPELNPFISKWMQAEDIHVASLLQLGLAANFHQSQYGWGEAGIYREGDYILAAGQENPRSALGHAIILGAPVPINYADQYQVHRLFFEEAKRQGAISGYAHGHRDHLYLRNGLAIDLPHELVSFLEVLQFGVGDYQIYYDILNSGFRLAPVAGSDYPCRKGMVPGWERTYSRIQGPLTYRSWMDSVRAGRTFVTNGPLLWLRVQGKDIGETLSLPRAGRVRVEGSVRFDPEMDDVQALEVVDRGQVVRRIEREAGKSEIRCRFDHPVGEAAWLALRVAGRKVASLRLASGILDPRYRADTMAHTAPVFVTVRGKPGLGEQPRAGELAVAWMKRLEALEKGLESGERIAAAKTTAEASGLQRSRPALLDAIQLAKAYFSSRARR